MTAAHPLTPVHQHLIHIHVQVDKTGQNLQLPQVKRPLSLPKVQSHQSKKIFAKAIQYRPIITLPALGGEL